MPEKLERKTKANSELIETLGWIETEISAGKCLFPRNSEEQAHNNACDRAITILRNYMDGCGLFQTMTMKSGCPRSPVGRSRS